MWLRSTLWKVCTQDLKAFLPSSSSQRCSRRGPVYCLEWALHGRTLPDRGGKLYGDLTHVFCPAEPTKNCPRDQPQDNSASHSLARATPTETSSAPLSGRAASQAWDHLLLWLILTLSSQRLVHFSFLPLHSPISFAEGCFPSTGGRPRLGSSLGPHRKSRWAQSKDFKGKSSNRS